MGHSYAEEAWLNIHNIKVVLFFTERDLSSSRAPDCNVAPTCQNPDEEVHSVSVASCRIYRRILKELYDIKKSFEEEKLDVFNIITTNRN